MHNVYASVIAEPEQKLGYTVHSIRDSCSSVSCNVTYYLRVWNPIIVCTALLGTVPISEFIALAGFIYCRPWNGFLTA